MTTSAANAIQDLLDDVASPKVEALIEAMVLAAMVDGELAPQESSKLIATIEALTNKKLSGEGLGKRIEALSTLTKREGRPARMSAVAARLAAGKPRETALMVAAAITAADGKLEGKENEFLADLGEALEISTERAVELIERVREG
jgi:tellurite resistance protein